MAADDRPLASYLASIAGSDPIAFASDLRAFVGAIEELQVASEPVDPELWIPRIGHRLVAAHNRTYELGRATAQLVGPKREFRELLVATSLREFREAVAWPRHWIEVDAIEGRASSLRLRAGGLELPMHHLPLHRRWARGFRSSDPALHRRLLRPVLAGARHRLAADFEAMPLLYGPKVPVDASGVDRARQGLGDADGRRFEALMLWILNESQERAVRAGLREDLLESTDLRVPGLGSSRKGLRIQVTRSIGRAALAEKRKRAGGRSLRWLSPRTVVQWAAADEARHARLVTAVWSPSMEPGIEALATATRDVLVRASTVVNSDPREPLASVPLALRELVREFVNAAGEAVSSP